jgi:phenylalanyl-tRNA synthetase beta chain
MKFSVEWLRELSNTKLKAPQIAELLSEHTAEAEVVGQQNFENIIVAEVTKVEKHPNADRLRIIELTDGHKTYAPVVCGAWNFDIGAKVVLALPGAIIPHDQHDPEGKPFTLTKATIRGVESQGMICSGKELGLSDDGQGIMLLDDSYKLGAQLTAGEEILDVSAFANRPDLHSYLGVGRELAALTSNKLNAPLTKKLPKTSKKIRIDIKNSSLCAHYSAITMSGVKIGPSPGFIQKRLKASGLRPINNVVDITNYVMLLTGQPLHAFDNSKVDTGIIIRNGESGEKLITLDGIERTLGKETLVIADHSKPLAIAGIIGGKDSAVTESTTDILLEAANFDAVAVRKASRRLNVRTDASSRFEKSLPISFVQVALELAASLFEQHAYAKIHDHASAGHEQEKPRIIPLNAKKVTNFLGLEIPAAEQKSILEKFGFKIAGSGIMKAITPAWRPDLSMWEDLAEEIVRYKGLGAVPETAPATTFSSRYTDPLVDFKETTTDILTRLGLSQIYTYSFTSANDTAALEVANPLNDDQKYLRTAILPNMLKVAALNSRYFDNGAYFEIGNVYRKGSGGFVEITKLGVIAYDKKDYSVAQVNGALLELADKLGIKLEFTQHSPDSADIHANGKAIGTVESISHPDIKLVGASLDLRTLMMVSEQRQFENIPRFPSKTLDTSILVGEDTAWAEIIKAAGKDPLLVNLTLIDSYRGKGIPSGKKSLTIRAVYQAPDRTLTDKEADSTHQQVLTKIGQKTGATIRQ